MSSRQKQIWLRKQCMAVRAQLPMFSALSPEWIGHRFHGNANRYRLSFLYKLRSITTKLMTRQQQVLELLTSVLFRTPIRPFDHSPYTYMFLLHPRSELLQVLVRP